MIVANGSTDVTTYFVLRDSTNHAPKTDVTVTDIDLYYVEELAAISAKADATALAAADSAHSDNKAYHVGQGLYRIDWPDAAFDGGVGKKVILVVVCTGVDTTFLEVELSPASDVRAFGGTAGTFSGGRPEVNATHWGGTAVASATVAANVTQISGDSTAADNLEAACDGTTYNIGGGAVVAASVTAEVSANVTKISGDATAADNAEAFFDGTGYAGTNNVIPSVTTVTGNVNGSVGSVTGAVGSVTGNVGGNVTGSVGSVAAGGITAASIATGAIDADAIAADAVNEIADQVWDEALSGHATGGTSGAALSAAGSAGDPWSTALPGAYGAGTAGKILGDNLNATVSSRASQTSVDTIDDYLDTEIAAIKAKTDLIPASPAAVGSAMTLASGAVDATALATDAAQEIADALLDRTAGVETGLTPRQFLRLAAAILFNKASGQGTGTETYRDYGDTKNRLVATLAAGARTFGTRDAT